jgi:hypothetical protein
MRQPLYFQEGYVTRRRYHHQFSPDTSRTDPLSTTSLPTKYVTRFPTNYVIPVATIIATQELQEINWRHITGTQITNKKRLFSSTRRRSRIWRLPSLRQLGRISSTHITTKQNAALTTFTAAQRVLYRTPDFGRSPVL